MTILIFGLVIFLGLHSTRIFAESGRERAIARLGEGPWKGVYALLSLVGFVLIVWGFGQARWAAPLDLGAAGLDPPHRAPPDAVQHDPARRLWPQEKPYRRRRPSPDAVGGRRVGRRASARQRLGWRTWSCSAPSSPGRCSTFRAITARDRAKAVVYPAPNWGATIGAIVVGVVLWVGLLDGPASLAVRRLAAGDVARNADTAGVYCAPGRRRQGKSPRRRYTRYTRQKIDRRGAAPILACQWAVDRDTTPGKARQWQTSPRPAAQARPSLRCARGSGSTTPTIRA